MSCKCGNTYGYGLCQNVNCSQRFRNSANPACKFSSCTPEFSDSGYLGLLKNPPIPRPPNPKPGDEAFPTSRLGQGNSDQQNTNQNTTNLTQNNNTSDTYYKAGIISVTLLLGIVGIVALAKSDYKSDSK